MTILKTRIMFVDLDCAGQTADIDTVEYEGKLWLVPYWLYTQDEKWRTPERIICLSSLPFDQAPPGASADYILQCPITKSVLNGQIPPPPSIEFQIVEMPDIELPSGASLN